MVCLKHKWSTTSAVVLGKLRPLCGFIAFFCTQQYPKYFTMASHWPIHTHIPPASCHARFTRRAIRYACKSITGIDKIRHKHRTEVIMGEGGVNIKSNHFYCHITTAQVPWWVKFLWACSRQCKKTTDNLPMDRQCKKTTNNLPMDRQCKKTTNNLPMDRQCKKTTNNLHMDRQCKKTALEHLQCSRQCKKTTTAIYIWTVHIYRLYRRQCAKYTYIYSVRLVYYRDILNYQRHIIHRMGTSTEKARVFLYTHHVFLRCKEIQKCQVKKRWYARTQTIYSTEYDWLFFFFFLRTEEIRNMLFCTIQAAFQQSL